MPVLSVQRPCHVIVPHNTSNIEMLRRPLESALTPPVAMVDQTVRLAWLPGVECLLQGIEHEVRFHAVAHTPADDASCEDIDNEGYIQPTLPR